MTVGTVDDERRAAVPVLAFSDLLPLRRRTRIIQFGKRVEITESAVAYSVDAFGYSHPFKRRVALKGIEIYLVTARDVDRFYI